MPKRKMSTQRRKTRKSSLNGPPPNASPGQHDNDANTPLKIPYGNKEIALKLGARYGAGGWYAPQGIDLSAFKDRGWL